MILALAVVSLLSSFIPVMAQKSKGAVDKGFWVSRYMSVCYPLKEVSVTSSYGQRKDPFTGKRAVHSGLDLKANNEPVMSMFDGIVEDIGSDSRSGRYIILRHGRRHQGIDLPYPSGTPVPATFDGKVRISAYVGGYGNLVVIRHANGLETFYGHLSRRDVEAGDWVSAGDIIGLGGSTGRSTGPHLHFETRYRGAAFDPAWLIDFETGTLRHRLLKIRSWYFNPNQRYVQNVDDEDEIFRTDEKDRLLAEEQAKKEAAARAAAEAAAMRYHTVRNGDTLSSIARRYGTSVNRICQLNGIKKTTVLKVGRRLRVR